MREIWRRHHRLIQWGVAALLALLLLLWVNGEQTEPQQEPQPPAEPEPVAEVVVEKRLPAEPEPEPVPEPAVAEVPIEVEPEPEAPPMEEETTPEPVLESVPVPEAEPPPEPEPVEEQLSEESISPICPQWTESLAVSRGTFTLGVDRVSREPLDSICRPTSEVRKIFYFSDLHNQFGKRIYHLWEYNGREMAKVALGRVGGPRWRVWSSKNLVPGWSGEWSVKVVTGDGTLLHQESFEYLAE